MCFFFCFFFFVVFFFFFVVSSFKRLLSPIYAKIVRPIHHLNTRTFFTDAVTLSHYIYIYYSSSRKQLKSDIIWLICTHLKIFNTIINYFELVNLWIIRKFKRFLIDMCLKHLWNLIDHVGFQVCKLFSEFLNIL